MLPRRALLIGTHLPDPPDSLRSFGDSGNIGKFGKGSQGGGVIFFENGWILFR